MEIVQQFTRNVNVLSLDFGIFLDAPIFLKGSPDEKTLDNPRENDYNTFMYPELFHFEIFGIDVHLYMYGLMIGIGLIAALGLLWWLCRRFNISDKTYNFYWVLGAGSIFIGFIGAYLFQLIYEAVRAAASGVEFKGTGGLTFMGGLVFGAAAFILGAIFFAKPKVKNDFHRIAGFAAPCIAIAHAFGRLGCFFAGCCYGIPNNDFGLEFPSGASRGRVLPTMLYESIFLFALFGVLMLLLLKYKKGNLTLPVYGLCYSVWRFFLEFLRGDERFQFGDALTPSQWQSVILFAAAGILLIYIYYFKKLPMFNPLFTDNPDEPPDEFYVTGADGAESGAAAGAETPLQPVPGTAAATDTSENADAPKKTKPPARFLPRIALKNMEPAVKHIKWLFFLGLAAAAAFAVTAFILLVVPSKNTTPLGVSLLLTAALMAAVAALDYFLAPKAAVWYDSVQKELVFDKRCKISAPPSLTAGEACFFAIPIADVARAYADTKPKTDYPMENKAARVLLGWSGYLATMKWNGVVIQAGEEEITVHNVLNLDGAAKQITKYNVQIILRK